MTTPLNPDKVLHNAQVGNGEAELEQPSKHISPQYMVESDNHRRVDRKLRSRHHRGKAPRGILLARRRAPKVLGDQSTRSCSRKAWKVKSCFRQVHKISIYTLNSYHGCDFSHLLTTLGMGHAVDFPLSSVRSYICLQHSYNLRSCMSHFDGLYVFLFKHA